MLPASRLIVFELLKKLLKFGQYEININNEWLWYYDMCIELSNIIVTIMRVILIFIEIQELSCLVN